MRLSPSGHTFLPDDGDGRSGHEDSSRHVGPEEALQCWPEALGRASGSASRDWGWQSQLWV